MSPSTLSIRLPVPVCFICVPSLIFCLFGYSSFTISNVILPQKVYLQKALILEWGIALKCNDHFRIWNKMLLLQSTLLYNNCLGQLPAEELAVVLQERTRWRKASLPCARTDFFTLQFKLVQFRMLQNFGCEEISTLRICLLEWEASPSTATCHQAFSGYHRRKTWEQ